MKNKSYQLALFGDPVHHSLSPEIHQHFAQQFDISINYRLIAVKKEQLQEAVQEFFQSQGHGANVTLPHKQNVMEFVHELSDLAQQAQAVNTLYKDERQIIGDNTDGVGFVCDLKQRCQFSCVHKKILILGAGGATQGIVPALMSQNPNKVVIVNRTLAKAENIATYPNSLAVDFVQLQDLNESFDLIVHSSSLGHQGKTLKFYPQHRHEQTIAYDLSYGAAAQAFIEHCQSLNITQVHDGLGMLIEQAALSFKLWFKLKPETYDLFKSRLKD